MKAYKGFNKDMTCRGFQFEEGKEYETDRAELCSEGFHACENPLDCFGYYTPGSSVFHEVEIKDNGQRNAEDTKVVGKKIKIGARLSVGDICKAHFKFVKSHTTTEHTDTKAANAGYRGSANAGYRGSANAGSRGSANAGDYGSANAGDYGSANAGDCGSANAGDYGSANAGYRGSANAGYRGSANAGSRGSANAGYRGSANAGDCGSATSRGSASVGDNGIAIARGENCRVKGKINSIILIAEEADKYKIVSWKAAVVDGEIIKADTWYKLENGEFVEA